MIIAAGFALISIVAAALSVSQSNKSDIQVVEIAPGPNARTEDEPEIIPEDQKQLLEQLQKK